MAVNSKRLHGTVTASVIHKTRGRLADLYSVINVWHSQSSPTSQ